MGNWIPGDPTLVAQILKISSAYTPAPPEGFISPMRWGVEEDVISRFENAGIARENISFSRETFTFQADYAPSVLVNNFKNYYGPTMNAFEAAEKTEMQTLCSRSWKNCLPARIKAVTETAPPFRPLI